MQTSPELGTRKNNRTPLIVATVAIVLCCCCVLLSIAGYYGYITTSRTQGIPTDLFETEPVLPNDSQAPTSEPFNSPGEAPTGGLGNDILRNDTWQAVAAAAVSLGCDQPVGADTEIEVLQQPQNGIWVEKWTVACSSGDTYPFEVEFVLDATGATFNIKSLAE